MAEQPDRFAAEPALFVVFSFDPENGGPTERVVFAVPESLLWSAKGLARIFSTCRLSWFGQNYDRQREDFSSWRLTEIRPEPQEGLHVMMHWAEESELIQDGHDGLLDDWPLGVEGKKDGEGAASPDQR